MEMWGEEQRKWNKQKANSKMVDLKPTISITAKYKSSIHLKVSDS